MVYTSVTATIVVGGGGTFGGNIVKNDHILVILDANGSGISSGHYNSATALTTIYLQSGDKLWIKGRWDSPHVLLGGGYSTFSVWMI
ncbi:hypothetical protein FSP39_006032 [Pinctada imbricata]|uniref:C1q domain-containing protein n=1 Tax=Pinctada imbricata TaxID=66713 RepID=A0AA88XLA1_PINIB|nr:hypothetical protein FSP39_006032 [Pinctada imbricata]